tara:strand:- start:397 stop:1557 length:1161 start_codon:yes stop_codon:yes gene_type:complete
MVRGLGVAFVLILCFAGCTQEGNKVADEPPVVAADFDGLSQDCFDSTVRVRSRNSIGSASAIKYIAVDGNTRSQVDSIFDATHVEFETNRHVAGDRGTQHVLDVWFDGRLVSSVKCSTDDSWFQSGVSKDIATLVVPLETLGGAMPIVENAPYGEAGIMGGSKIFTVGCSDGRVPRARCGQVLKIENGLIYYLPQSISGDSGSSVFAYSREREQWEVVGRTAWAIKTESGWVGLAMTSDRVADIRSGRVAAGDFELPTGAVPLGEAGDELPTGAITCDEIKSVATTQDSDPEPLDVSQQTKRWRFPIRREDIRERPPRTERVRDWSILGGVADFIRSLIRFAFATAVVLLLVGLYIAPTILTPLKYNWPIVAVKQLLALIGRTNAK